MRATQQPHGRVGCVCWAVAASLLVLLQALLLVDAYNYPLKVGDRTELGLPRTPACTEMAQALVSALNTALSEGRDVSKINKQDQYAGYMVGVVGSADGRKWWAAASGHKVPADVKRVFEEVFRAKGVAGTYVAQRWQDIDFTDTNNAIREELRHQGKTELFDESGDDYPYHRFKKDQVRGNQVVTLGSAMDVASQINRLLVQHSDGYIELGGPAGSCAAFKLATYLMQRDQPPLVTCMDEVLFAPDGVPTVTVYDSGERALRYRHGDSVPSCLTCQFALRKLLGAYTSKRDKIVAPERELARVRQEEEVQRIEAERLAAVEEAKLRKAQEKAAKKAEAERQAALRQAGAEQLAALKAAEEQAARKVKVQKKRDRRKAKRQLLRSAQDAEDLANTELDVENELEEEGLDVEEPEVATTTVDELERVDDDEEGVGAEEEENTTDLAQQQQQQQQQQEAEDEDDVDVESKKKKKKKKKKNKKKDGLDLPSATTVVDEIDEENEVAVTKEETTNADGSKFCCVTNEENAKSQPFCFSTACSLVGTAILKRLWG